MSVVIHLGGQLPSRRLAQELAAQADRIIAADSGYDCCLMNGLVPHVVTGDFDSIKSIPSTEGISVIPSKEQTATDFEKALRLVPEDTTRIDILGGTGLRSDHFLTNLLVSLQQPASQTVVFHDDLQVIHRVTPDCPYNASLPINTVISLIPFPHCSGTVTRGLHWNLEDAEMGPSEKLGQSNRVASKDVSVSIRGGWLFVVVNQLQ